MSRSLNKATLIGNLTRDPELRYTPQGTAVCTFSVATNRQWKTDSGDTKEDVEFHRVVAWDKLAEICSNMLTKGKKVFVEGRIQTRKWQTQDGQDRTTTEIVISDMLLLDRAAAGNFNQSKGSVEEDLDIPDDFADLVDDSKKPGAKAAPTKPTAKPAPAKPSKAKEDDEIPF